MNGVGHIPPALPDQATLVDLLDGLIDRGVVVSGDIMLSVAEIDLVHLGLQLVLRGVAEPGRTDLAVAHPTAHQFVESPGGEPELPAPLGARSVSGGGSAPASRVATDPAATLSEGLRRLVAGGGSGELDPEDVQRGLASLVLTLVEILRDLMERQALRRMDTGSVTDDEVERLGRTFLALQERMEQLKEAFGLTDHDLKLDLGPLGRLR